MSVVGPNPLDSEDAETAYGRLFFNLQKIIAADLRLAASETKVRTDRAIMGAVVATRVLLEAFPKKFSYDCHTDDFVEWKSQYLAWFGANSKHIRLKKAERDRMRRLAAAEFDRIIELSQATSYRFAQKLEMTDDTSADLRYFGKDGRIIEVPRLNLSPPKMASQLRSAANDPKSLRRTKAGKSRRNSPVTLQIDSRLRALGRGEFGLSIESGDEQTYGFFNEQGLSGDGCTWHAVVDSLIRSHMPLEIDRMRLTSEAGGLLIISDKQQLLKRVATLIRDAIKSEASLVRAIKRANPELLE